MFSTCSFSPPDWVFGFAWTLLYTAIGFASFVVWTEGGLQKHAGAFVLYAVQLALNAAWAPAFFKAHNFSLASTLSYGELAVFCGFCT
jgi:benzodiazapine receptor